MKTTAVVIALIFWLISVNMQAQSGKWIANPPSGSKYTKIDMDGITIIPDGRIIKPYGKTYKIAPHPFGLILSPDGMTAITANSGVRPFSISIIRNVFSAVPKIQQIPEGSETDKGALASVYMGLAASPDNKLLYAAGGQEGKIFIFDIENGNKKGEINCNDSSTGIKYKNSYIGDMVISKDGKYLYSVDQNNFRLIIVDTKIEKVITSVKVGRYPFGIALSPDQNTVYVANVGMYEYKLIPGIDSKNLDSTALKFPAFGYLSKESEEGTIIDGKKIPGLGAPTTPESFSVWAVDVASSTLPVVKVKIKTGILVGEMVDGVPAVGGASPNSIVATSTQVFVSNGNNDCISVINTKTNSVDTNLFLRLDKRLGNLRGIIPYGLALSPDNKRLYVAEAGINSVGVIDIENLKIIGEIPVGWFPSKLKVSNDGKQLVVANAKGWGSGPNGGTEFKPGPDGAYVGNLMHGSVSVFQIPDYSELKKLSEKVIEYNFDFNKASSHVFNWRRKNPIPLYSGQKKSPIKYIVFVSKENRTYDEIFGQVKKGKGDSTLARYGEHQSFNNGRGDYIKDVTVMPNHLQLAHRFGIGDNFYCNSDHSADGHRWLQGTYPNEWVETNVPASYGGGRDMDIDAKAPGEFSKTGSSAAIYPEDYNEGGSLWDHLERGDVDFFNFGLGLELAPGIEELAYKYTGIRNIINYPVPAPIMENSSKLFATFNTNIPDQFRIDMFQKEFNDRWVSKGKNIPNFLSVYLPNDHGSGIRPEYGYPFTESYMMDNDLALGRLVDFLSHSKYWKNMAIVVTEDDPQGGVDHVDAHRSVLMVISPFAKKNYVSHVHYSFGSIMKTFWHLLRLPYLNQYDFSSADLADFFTDKPDYTPYNVKSVDPEVFNPQKALTPLDEKFDWSQFNKSPVLDDPELLEKWNKTDLEKRMHLADPPFAPDIIPNSEIFRDTLSVTLKNVFQNAAIRYTLDGSEPDPQSQEYKTPILINKTTTVKARSFWETNLGSRTKEAVYTKAEYSNPVKPLNASAGLTFSSYEGVWDNLPDFSKLIPTTQGEANDIGLNLPNAKQENWAAVFSGYFEAPKDALYTFYLSSDDGSRFYLNDLLVVNNDGLHGMNEVSGKAPLKAGKHKIKIEFFQQGGGQGLLLKYESAGIKKQIIPASLYSH